MLGEDGGDLLFDGDLDDRWEDVPSGGNGDDIFVVDNVPAVRDKVSCGGGFDRVLADSKDLVADDCERVRVVHGSKAEVQEQQNAFFESLTQAERVLGHLLREVGTRPDCWLRGLVCRFSEGDESEEGRVLQDFGHSFCPYSRTSWNRNSAIFVFWGFSEVRLTEMLGSQIRPLLC
jgi:hypothetical protein